MNQKEIHQLIRRTTWIWGPNPPHILRAENMGYDYWRKVFANKPDEIIRAMYEIHCVMDGKEWDYGTIETVAERMANYAGIHILSPDEPDMIPDDKASAVQYDNDSVHVTKLVAELARAHSGGDSASNDAIRQQAGDSEDEGRS